MKPTHKNNKGEKFCYIKIKQKVDADAIETAIMKLLDMDEKVTRTAVNSKLKEILYHNGSEAIRGCGVLDNDNWYADDVELLTKQAKEISKKLFPAFY